jgi:hypothetical protein
MYHIAATHEDAMQKLITLYKVFDPGSLGDLVEAEPIDHFMDEFKSAQELVGEALAHRQKVQDKVEAAKAAVVAHQERIKEAERTALEEMGIDADAISSPPATAFTAGNDVAEGADSKLAQESRINKERIRLLEGRVKDLQAEISEEHVNYQDMQQAKDEQIDMLKLQIERSQEQMESVIGATAHELADSAAAVEDTRLHIAYLTVQLRNARELADARSFDVNKWVKRADHETVVKQVNSLKMQVSKLSDRIQAEQRNTDEAHAYAKKCLRAKEKADLAHADWELKLRETLKTRDQDLVNLNFETRLLHNRAEKLVREIQETRLKLEREKKEAIDQAMQSMEDQRQAFNELLQGRDAVIRDLKTQNQTLNDDLHEMATRLQIEEEKLRKHVDEVKQAEESRLARQTHRQMMTEPVKFSYSTENIAQYQPPTFPAAVIQDKEVVHEVSAPSIGVSGIMWKVLRRKFAIEAIGALDRMAQRTAELEDNLRNLEEAVRTKWRESEQHIKRIQAALGDTIPKNLKRMNVVLSSLETFASREMTALERRSQLKSSVAQAMHKMRSNMVGVVNSDLFQLVEDVREEIKEIQDIDEDASELELTNTNLCAIRAEIDRLRSITTQAHIDAGQNFNDKLHGLHNELHDLLNGDILQSVISCRMRLIQEQQISQRFDLEHHRKCLTKIAAGDFADSLPTSSAGSATLSHPHHEESRALGEIIKEWNRQKSEWAKERLQLIQIDAAQPSNVQPLLDGSLINSSSDTKASFGAGTNELAHYGTSARLLEMEMDALSTAIANWCHQNNEYEFVDIESEDDLVPTLWRKCMRLIQAAYFAFQRARNLQQLGVPSQIQKKRPLKADAADHAIILKVKGKEVKDRTRKQGETVVPQQQGSSDQRKEVKSGDTLQMRTERFTDTEDKVTDERTGEDEVTVPRSESSAAEEEEIEEEEIERKNNVRMKIMHTNQSGMRKCLQGLRDILNAPSDCSDASSPEKGDAPTQSENPTENAGGEGIPAIADGVTHAAEKGDIPADVKAAVPADGVPPRASDDEAADEVAACGSDVQSESTTAVSWHEAVPFTVTLDVDFNSIRDQEAFQQGVMKDIAKAAKVNVKYVKIAGLRAGSVIIDMLISSKAEFLGGFPLEPTKIVQGLLEQLTTPDSLLMRGKFTSKICSLSLVETAQAERDKGHVGTGAEGEGGNASVSKSESVYTFVEQQVVAANLLQVRFAKITNCVIHDHKLFYPRNTKGQCYT